MGLWQWLSSGQRGEPAGTPTGDNPAEPVERVRHLDFPRCLAEEFPKEFPGAWATTGRILASLPGSDFRALERRSPGLRGYDWNAYLSLSTIRVVRALNALSGLGVTGGRLLDYGAYFGNFALAARAAGYTVHAADSYGQYGDAFARIQGLMRDDGITTHDFSAEGYGLSSLADGHFDVVLCMGVVEHIAHTPRPLMEALTRLVRPGGLLVLDTPNLCYIYNQRRLAAGKSVFAPLAGQYYTEIPFEGHHREFTADEVRWLLDVNGFDNVFLDLFNYSLFGLDTVAGDDLNCLEICDQNPGVRELILAIGRRSRHQLPEIR